MRIDRVICVKKIASASTAAILSFSCASSQPTANPPQEGFTDADTLVVAAKGDSRSFAKARTASSRPVALELARAHAVDRAKQRAMEECSPQQAACGPIGQNKDLQGRVRGAKLVYSDCSESTEGDSVVIQCRVAIEVKMKGLQALCESAQKSQAASCVE